MICTAYQIIFGQGHVVHMGQKQCTEMHTEFGGET